MKSIEDYTLAELIYKYKKYIGDEIEQFLINAGYEADIIEKLREKARMNKILNSDKNLTDAIYDALCDTYIGAEENKQDVHKLSFLARIYKFYSSKLSKEDLAELKKLIINGEKYAILKFPYKKDDMVDFIIITDEPRKKTSSFKSSKTKKVIENAIAIAMSGGDIKNLINFKYRGLGDILNDILEDYSDADQKEYYLNNLQYFKYDDLLLNAAARVMLGIERGIVNSDIQLNEVENKNTMSNSIDYIRNIRRELARIDEKERDHGEYAIIDKDGTILVRASDVIIDEFLSRCIQDKYYTKEQVAQMQQDVLRGILPKSEEERKVAKIDKHYVINISKKYEVMQDNDVNKQDVLKCGIELANMLMKQKEVTYEELLQSYIHGLIDLDIMRDIDLENIKPNYFNDIFEKMYAKFIYSRDEEVLKEREEELNRYGQLYSLMAEGKHAKPEDLIFNIINSYGEENLVEILNDLNKFGILSVEQCYDYAGMDFFIEKYKKGSFTPGQIRELYDKSVIDLSDLISLIEIIPETEKKYMSIGAIFPDENEEDTIHRNLLVEECINVNNGINSKNGNKRKKIIVDPKHKSDGTITDPYARLSLFRELDENYELLITDDAHAIVKCPSSGKVIIEKMLDKKGNPYYGAATYVLDKKYYEDHEMSICISDMIDRHELSTNAKTKGVDRIPHDKDKWGEKIKEIFGVETEGKYTKEKNIRINEAIARVERSRKSRSEI